MNDLTLKELELVYDALDDKFSNTINGDWKAVRGDSRFTPITRQSIKTNCCYGGKQMNQKQLENLMADLYKVSLLLEKSN